MSDTTAPRAMSGHTPVSNAPTESDFPPVRRTEQQGDARGSDPRTVAPRNDGSENVDRPAQGLESVEAPLVGPDTSALRDIAVASFGERAALETVHGHDDRVQVTNTDVYPWRVHASLLITAADNSQWIGTGWFIGPHTLITAGHVVHIKNSGVPGRDGWVKNIIVMPGRNGTSLPYGSVTSTNFHSVTGWTNNGDENYDYAAIIIPNELGNTVGWLGFGVYTDAELLATTGNISGYPGDKPSGTQWYDSHKVDSVNERKVFYDIDTFGGQSGAAVYRIINNSRFAFAVHAYGGGTTNSGTRIIKPVYDNMVNWKA